MAIQIVARASLAAIRGRRVARGPKSRVGSRIVSPGDPRGRAPDFPRLAFPSFMPRLAGTWDGVKAPFALAGPSIIAVNKSANPIFPARHSDQHEILGRQRRKRD